MKKRILLSANSVRTLVGPLGITIRLTEDSPRYSIILDTARSLEAINGMAHQCDILDRAESAREPSFTWRAIPSI